MLRILATFALIVLAATRPAVGASTRDHDALTAASYVYVATVRKDGTQSRAVPVWFIANRDDHVLIDTNSDSWKARRIQRGSPVLVWIGSRNGPAFIGRAEVVADRPVRDFMIEQIPKKYFLARVGLFGPSRAKFDAGKIVTIRIAVERDLPDDFRSQPGASAPSLAQEPKPASPR
jgi:hypothetical protein